MFPLFFQNNLSVLFFNLIILHMILSPNFDVSCPSLPQKCEAWLHLAKNKIIFAKSQWVIVLTVLYQLITLSSNSTCCLYIINFIIRIVLLQLKIIQSMNYCMVVTTVLYFTTTKVFNGSVRFN